MTKNDAVEAAAGAALERQETVSRETGAHEMNDTTRDKLRERIEAILDSDIWFSEPYRAEKQADQIIALVTAARDAEIREALNTVSWGGIATDVLVADEYGGNYDDLLRQVTDAIWEEQEAALSHIGLHGDETGGQG